MKIERLIIIAILSMPFHAGALQASVPQANDVVYPNATTTDKALNYAARIAYEFVKFQAKTHLLDNFMTFTHEMGHALVAKALNGQVIHVVLGTSETTDKFLFSMQKLGVHVVTLHWSEGYSRRSHDEQRPWANFLIYTAGGVSSAVSVYLVYIWSSDSWLAPFNQLSELAYAHESTIEYLGETAFLIYVNKEMIRQVLYAFLPTVTSSGGNTMVHADYDGVKAIMTLGIPATSAIMAKLGHVHQIVKSTAWLALIGSATYQLYFFAPYLIESEMNYWNN